MTQILRSSFALCALALSLFAAPAMAKAQSAGPLFATREEVDAAMFVLERFLDDEATIADLGRIYADQVDYLDNGVIAREDVIELRKTFRSRWLARKYRPDLSTLEVTRDGDTRFVIKLAYDYTLKNKAVILNGRSLVDLTIQKQGDYFEVVRETGALSEKPQN